MINSNMYNYICETPEVLHNILKNRKDIVKDFVDHYKDIDIEQIYILGSGTSYHAAVNAKKYLEEILNKKVFVMYPTQFNRDERVFNKKSLVIGISQGGQSLSTVEGLDSAKAQALYTAAVSENPTALIFEHAETQTRIMVNNEKCGAKTKGFAASTLTVELMLTELAIEKNELSSETATAYFDRMEKVIDNMNNVIDASTLWYKRIKEDFLPAKRIIVVGYDNNYGSVLEGALKILETVRQGVTGYDIEEFFHGIYNSVTEESYIFYMASEGDYKPRTEKLIEILSEWTPHNYLIGRKEGLKHHSDMYCLVDFVEDNLFSCWEYIIPLQIVSCMAALDLGRNPDIPKDPKFHTRIGSKELDGVRDHYEK